MTADPPVELSVSCRDIEVSSTGTIGDNSAPAEPSRPRVQFRPRRWWWLGLALVPMAGMAATRSLGQAADPGAAPPPLPVAVVSPQAVSSYSVSRDYAGEIVAARSSRLGFEAGGTVVALLVDEGDTVTAGQPLARLDTRHLSAQRQQLVAQLDQAQAQLQELQAGPRQQDIAAAQSAVADLQQQVALAQLQRDRRQDLYNRGAISQEELDQQTFGAGSLENRLAQAQSQLDELQAGTRPEQIAAQGAGVRQLQASLEAIDVDLAKSVITAPFSGRISQRLVDEGVVVASGQAVLELVEGDKLEARIGVPADVADQLKIGSQQTLNVGGASLPASLIALLPELESSSRTVTAVLRLPPNATPTIGQTTRLVLRKTQPTSGFWLPATALVPGEQELWSVYVVAPGGDAPSDLEVARRPVEIIHTDGDRVLVQGMVQPSDQVIPAGVQRVVPGQTVRVIE